MYTIYLEKKAEKDALKISRSHLQDKVKELIEILKKDPFQNPPEFKELSGDYYGMYSRRINKQHRLVYEVYIGQKIVKILRMWSHYGDN